MRVYKQQPWFLPLTPWVLQEPLMDSGLSWNLPREPYRQDCPPQVIIYHHSFQFLKPQWVLIWECVQSLAASGGSGHSSWSGLPYVWNALAFRTIGQNRWPCRHWSSCASSAHICRCFFVSDHGNRKSLKSKQIILVTTPNPSNGWVPYGHFSLPSLQVTPLLPLKPVKSTKTDKCADASLLRTFDFMERERELSARTHEHETEKRKQWNANVVIAAFTQSQKSNGITRQMCRDFATDAKKGVQCFFQHPQYPWQTPQMRVNHTLRPYLTASVLEKNLRSQGMRIPTAKVVGRHPPNQNQGRRKRKI